MMWMLVGGLLLAWLFGTFATGIGPMVNLLLVAIAAVVMYTLENRGRITL